ncbi:uncharacterized protein LOC115003936 [Cottoperca gobio]|uniref:Uncharacterized protein LOC115003936 n=1 Tax=Cottoperca gobio TaxID=56716 RepID=A0A6J2P8P5_COTGO|nr:uncharacterized protein LOC115003936 [Cottoperca gobio]
MAIKTKVPKKERNTFVMFTKGTGPCKNLNSCLRMAWAELRIGGNVSFTLIRTALAHYAKKTTDVTARKRVADFMCHDVTTADCFYARCPDVKEAMAIRSLIRDSLRTEERAGPSTAVVASFTPLGGGTCVEEINMTSVRECPVCLNEYSQLGKHLRQTHRVKNETERKILLKLGSGRTDVRTEPCGVGGCQYQGSRLDRHIRDIHSEMTVEAREEMMKTTK